MPKFLKLYLMLGELAKISGWGAKKRQPLSESFMLTRMLNIRASKFYEYRPPYLRKTDYR